MPNVAESSALGDILEFAAASVPEKLIAHARARDKQVGPSVVINITERRSHRDFSGHRHACAGGDVLELSAAEVLKKTIGPELVYEINIRLSIAVYVGHGQSGAMIIMRRLPVLSA